MSRETPPAADQEHRIYEDPYHGISCTCGTILLTHDAAFEHGFEVGLSAPAERTLHADPD